MAIIRKYTEIQIAIINDYYYLPNPILIQSTKIDACLTFHRKIQNLSSFGIEAPLCI